MGEWSWSRDAVGQILDGANRSVECYERELLDLRTQLTTAQRERDEARAALDFERDAHEATKRAGSDVSERLKEARAEVRRYATAEHNMSELYMSAAAALRTIADAVMPDLDGLNTEAELAHLVDDIQREAREALK